MLDIHPAHHAATTWRDFFIHITTIVIGLLIAIGLEQSVERLHHLHQLRELRSALREDAEKTVRETPNEYLLLQGNAAWLAAREEQVQQSLNNHQPVPAPPPRPHRPSSPVPIEPAWKAAETSGLVYLLPQDEVKDYTEVDTLFKELERFTQGSALNSPYYALLNFEQSFCGKVCDDHSFLQASPPDLRRYIELINAIRLQTLELADVLSEIYNADVAILKGERRLEAIQAAEEMPMPANP
jgi:hypothetical protein